MSDNSKKVSRRDLLKGLATTPILGLFAYGWYKKRKYDLLLDKVKPYRVNIETENPVPLRNV